MRIAVAGAHGKVAQHLGRMAVARGNEVVGLVRSVDQLPALSAQGVLGRLLDLEDASVDAVAEALESADVAVFAAGAGPGSGAARKDTVDRAAAVLLADACERAGVPRLVQVSSMGTEGVRDGAVPAGRDDVFVAYLRAKLAAEDDLRSRERLGWTILRPGRLTNGPGTGRVSLASQVARGSVPREDVAAVLLGLIDAPRAVGLTLELVAGNVPVAEAIQQTLPSSST